MDQMNYFPKNGYENITLIKETQALKVYYIQSVKITKNKIQLCTETNKIIAKDIMKCNS